MILTICYDIIVDNVLQNFAICNWWRCPGQLYFSIRMSQSNNILWLLWHSWFRRSCCNDSCCRLWCCCWCRCSCGNTVSCITDESKLKKKLTGKYYWCTRHWQVTMFCNKQVWLLFHHSITTFVFIFNTLSTHSLSTKV